MVPGDAFITWKYEGRGFRKDEVVPGDAFITWKYEGRAFRESGDDEDVGLHVLKCRADILGTKKKWT